MKEMPNVPTVEGCPCGYSAKDCRCGLSERALRAWGNGTLKEPMTSEQREWCLSEIGSVEGYSRKHYVDCTDAQLARGVLSAWTDYCRDKGMLD